MERTNQRALPLVLFAIALALLAARVVSHFMQPAKTVMSEVAVPETTKPKELVQWVSLDEGKRRTAASHKPILYDFTAEWCGPCHMLDAEVFQNADMAREINARFIAVRVTDRQQEEGRNPEPVAELQRRYAVGGFPTVIIAGADGAELARMEGFRDREGFARVMESVR